jgi:hypothetical protein
LAACSHLRIEDWQETMVLLSTLGAPPIIELLGLLVLLGYVVLLGYRVAF